MKKKVKTIVILLKKTEFLKVVEYVKVVTKIVIKLTRIEKGKAMKHDHKSLIYSLKKKISRQKQFE